MARFIVEGGIYLLIFFTPFAFGGVELWAQGVLQIVAGLVVAAGAWGLLAAPAASSLQTRRGLRLLPLWIPLGLFVLLAQLQLTPLPASWLRSVSPSAHTLYASTIPGYAEGAPFEPADIAAWVLERHAARIPEPGAESPPDDLLRPPVHAASIAGPLPAGRTISIAPFETRQRLVLLCCLIGLFAVTLHFYDSRERIARLAAACVAAATVLSMVGILQKLTGGGRLLWLRSVDSLTTFGPFVNRNNYAAFAGLFFPVALSLTLAELGRVRERRRNALPRLLLWGFASVTCGAGIFFSLSRGGILAAGLSILILAGFLVYFGRQAAEIAMLAVILAACAGFLFWIGPEKVIERVGTLSEGQSMPSAAHRLGAWERALALASNYPVLGSGLGTFRFAYMQYAPPGEMWWTAAHNEYLELLCEVGIAGGLLALAGAAAWLVRAGRPGLFRGRSDRHLYAGMAAGLAGLMAHSAVSPHLQVPALGLVFALTTAFTLRMALNREAAAPPRGSQPQRLLKVQGAGARRALLAGLTIAAALNSLSGAFRIAGFLDQHRGERALAEARLNDAYDSILEASRWMPGNPTPWVFLARVLQHAQANGIPLDSFEGSSTMETFGAGVGYLARAIALNPADGWSWYNLANNYQGIRTARHRLERMRAAGERATRVSEPPAAQEPTKQGRLDPEDRISVAAMLQAVEREPESYVYPDALAKLYWDRGLAEAASDQIRASLTLTPRLKAHAVLEAPGLLAGLEGAILEGIERAGEGEFSGPVMRARARAEILQRLGRLDEAAAAYGELRELAGSDLAAECDLAVGKIHLQQDRYREAATHLERAAAAGAGDPHGVAALFHLGAAVARLGEHERAVELFRRYLNLRPDTMGAYFGLADSLEALGLHEEAERTLVGAVRRFPSDGTAYMRIIHHLRTRGRPGEALLYAEGLGKVEPGDERVQQLIAELRRESGRRPR